MDVAIHFFGFVEIFFMITFLGEPAVPKREERAGEDHVGFFDPHISAEKFYRFSFLWF
jgi:hypothetical protein